MKPRESRMGIPIERLNRAWVGRGFACESTATCRTITSRPLERDQGRRELSVVRDWENDRRRYNAFVQYPGDWGRLMKKLLDRLREAARTDPETVWSGVATPADIEAAEDFLGFAIPKLLKRLYLEISNGGFGPGPLMGLPGGYALSRDVLTIWEEFQEDGEFEEGWLPIIEWGCGNFSLIDCVDLHMVTLYEGHFHLEDYTFETMLRRWLDGESPALHSGKFSRNED